METRIPFPTVLPDVHSGIPVGNGIAGALMWIDQQSVVVSFNRSDYWDRRGSLRWNHEMRYDALKDLLHAGRASEVVRIFKKPDAPEIPERPTRLPMGRLVLDLPEGARVTSAWLDLDCGRACMHVLSAEGSGSTVLVSMKGTEPVLLVHVAGAFTLPFRARPSNPRSEADSYATAAWRLAPPTMLEQTAEQTGWVQEIPDGSFLSVRVQGTENSDHDGTDLLLQVSCEYGETSDAAVKAAGDRIERASFERLSAATCDYWRKFWSSAAIARTHIEDLDRQYLMGLYRLGASSVQGLDAMGLQGPWIEDHRMPPWSGDFHLNVNIQECYWPAFSGNCMESARPLVDFVRRLEPVAQEYARYLAGVDDGYHLPHAVDDTGACMGGFWTGSIDHGSTAWLIHTVVEYCRYAHRIDLYRDVAIPLLCKVLRVSRALLSVSDDGAYRFDVSVSPELGGANEDAWGVNASYQLAAIHACARDLSFCIRMCEGSDIGRIRMKVPDLSEMQSFAGDVRERLPGYAGVRSGSHSLDELCVFEDTPLPHSHRHHSHLAGLWPLQTVSADGEDADAVTRALDRWVRLGTGEWSGWSFPWASIIHSHTGSPDTALHLLKTFLAFFCNEGYATSHDARHPGLTVLNGRPDIMQLEAGLGFSAAVLELIVRTDASFWESDHMAHLQGYNIATSLPEAIHDLSFSRVRLPGAVLVSGEVRSRRLTHLEFESEQNCTIRVVVDASREHRIIELPAGRSVRAV